MRGDKTGNKISKNFLKKNLKGQVWIETVIYTLIAFVIIGMVLAFAKPKIEELQDKSIIEQSISMLEEIDGILDDIQAGGPENKRELVVGLKKGDLIINGTGDMLVYEIKSDYMYSEPGIEFEKGNLIIYNQQVGDVNRINITAKYKDKYDIKWEGKDESKLLTKTSNEYKLFITHKGFNEDNKIKVNFEVV